MNRKKNLENSECCSRSTRTGVEEHADVVGQPDIAPRCGFAEKVERLPPNVREHLVADVGITFCPTFSNSTRSK
jgi:hypothetical protein